MEEMEFPNNTTTPENFAQQNHLILEAGWYPPGTNVIVKRFQNNGAADREGYVMKTYVSTETYDILFVEEVHPKILLGVPHMLVVLKDEPRTRPTNYGVILGRPAVHLTWDRFRHMHNRTFLPLLETYQANYSEELDRIVEEEYEKGKFEGDGTPPPPKPWVYSMTLRL